MEIIKFAAWAIKKMPIQERILYLFLLWTSFLFVNLHFFGPIGFVIFFSGILLLVVLLLFRHIYKDVLNSWEKYKFEKDCEADRIVNRLKGQK